MSRVHLCSKSRLLIISVSLACIVIWVAVWAQSDHILKVIFFDVEHGDAALIFFPEGGNMLIDGGGSGKGRRIILPYLRKEGIKRINTVVLTNSDPDHVSGLIDILRNLTVGLVLVSDLPYASELHAHDEYIGVEGLREFLDVVAEKNIPCESVHRGQELQGFSGVRLDFFNPAHRIREGTGSSGNNDSVVLKLSYGEVDFLFCSDIEHGAEKDMVRVYRHELNSKVIKVPHHGSESSSSWNFLNRVKPDIAVVSVGSKGRKGYPDSITLRNYERIGSRVYRTDRDGAITISSDGKSLQVYTMK